MNHLVRLIRFNLVVAFNWELSSIGSYLHLEEQAPLLTVFLSVGTYTTVL